MKIFVRDNRAVCPCCSGLITARQNYYFCNDCQSTYIGVENGRTEGEVFVNEVIPCAENATPAYAGHA